MLESFLTLDFIVTSFPPIGTTNALSFFYTPKGKHATLLDDSPHSGVSLVTLFQSSTIVGQIIQSTPTQIVPIPGPTVQTPPPPLQTPIDVPMDHSSSVEPPLDHDLPIEEVQRDEHRKVVITLDTIQGPYHHYEEVPEDVQLKWWTYFKCQIT
ncbi:hypothetical protein DEO72_LG10g1808 [Vigna unguiculata]|uniref:Uncharacterized protein n=1 Tax=Vigna unguiculata TaxID=3917 RepID=A0A4D6NB82_VIGUN|nr:hypothetical protein DEO72_LG10g1808 [Vigna unguiculata]